MDWTWEVHKRWPMMTTGLGFAYLIINQISYKYIPSLLKIAACGGISGPWA